jgi:hypothetical protein
VGRFHWPLNTSAAPPWAAFVFAPATSHLVRGTLPLWFVLIVSFLWHYVTGTSLQTFGVTYVLLLAAWFVGARHRRREL